jgi:hypothetical protein
MMWRFEDFQLKLAVPDPKPRTLVVCFSRMYYFEKWQIALAAIELYSLHGADMMVIPISSIIDKLYTVLQAYESTGKVKLKQAIKIPLFVSHLWRIIKLRTSRPV